MMNKTFTAHLDNLYEMLLFIRNQAESMGFDEIEISKIELAAEEALVNIISYGYPVTSGKIEIFCERVNNNGLKIVIKDNGVPFNPLSNSKQFDPQAPVEARAVGGYGVFFIMKIMDEVEYNRVDNSNVLSMIKYFATDS
jgi:serine/threonine-protein kinase RsbW